jgi:predicted DsbA family dithiol-disulfide isomerase
VTWLERRFGAEIEWQPFDLHPEYPPEGIPRSELERRYGREFAARQQAMFAAAGLPYTADIGKLPNSHQALVLTELARDRGCHDELHARLFDALWARGLDLGDEAVLLAEGAAVGLAESDMRAALADPVYAERVRLATEAVTEIGAGGVPAFVIDRRLLVPGAQPHEVFERILEGLGHAPLGGDPA